MTASCGELYRIELASNSTVSVSTRVLPPGYSTWPQALWNDVMVKEGISMETPTIVVSIEISRTIDQN